MNLLLVVFVLALYALSIWCLVFPRAVQSYARRSATSGITGRLRFLRRYMESPSYLTNVRAVGVIALLMAALLTFASLRTTQ
jgi:hypothetical protein